MKEQCEILTRLRAERFAELATDHGLSGAQIRPMADPYPAGGYAVLFERDKRYAYVEFLHTGKVGAALSDRDKDVQSFDFRIVDSRKVVERIKKYLQQPSMFT